MYSQSGANVWDRPAGKQPVVKANAWSRPPVTKRPTEEIEAAMKNVEIDTISPNVYEMKAEMGRLRELVDGLRDRSENMQAELHAHEGRFEGMKKELAQLKFSVNSRPVGSAGSFVGSGMR